MLTNRQQAGSYFARKRNRRTVLSNDLSQPARGSILFTTNVAQTITLGGTVVTFGTSFALGATLADTVVNLLAFLAASNDANIVKCKYSNGGSSISIVSKTLNDATFTLAASAGTVSHSTLQLEQVYKRAAL